MTIVLDGKKVANYLNARSEAQVSVFKDLNIQPKLVIVSVGDDAASASYIRTKTNLASKIGIETEVMHIDKDTSSNELIRHIRALNKDDAVHGIIVQLPLPSHIYTPEVLKNIDPNKDVDGLTAYNLGKTFINADFERLSPCTPSGIIELLNFYETPVIGKNVVVIGSSILAGKSMAVMMINRGATVTVCNSKTADLTSHTKNADILIVAVGKPNLITDNMVKKGVIVIDVGINRLEDNSIVGDVDFEAVSKKASAITPVPGGIGPLTVACLMRNLLRSLRSQLYNK